jgi:hypothetical protein
MSQYYKHRGKARVRRTWHPMWGWAWEASKPGSVYLVGEGFHFGDWDDAIAYALSPSVVNHFTSAAGEQS